MVHQAGLFGDWSCRLEVHAIRCFLYKLTHSGLFFGGLGEFTHVYSIIFHFVPSISPHKVYRLDSPRNHSVSKIRVNASMQDSEGKVSAFRRKGGKRQQERKQTEVVSSDAGSFKVGVEFLPWIFNHQC